MNTTGTVVLRQHSIPPLVPIGRALDALFDNNLSALSAPSSDRRYDEEALECLRQRLIEIGAGVRGQVDRRQPDWFVLQDFRFKYRRFFVPHHVGMLVIVAESIHHYPADEIRDQSALRTGSDSVVPYFGIVVRNIEVEKPPLVAALTPAAPVILTTAPAAPTDISNPPPPSTEPPPLQTPSPPAPAEPPPAALAATEAADTASVASATPAKTEPPTLDKNANADSGTPTIVPTSVAALVRSSGGRPTSRDLIRKEAQRQLDEVPDLIPPTVGAWGCDLSEWLATEHPDAPQAQADTAEEHIRDLHRLAKGHKSLKSKSKKR